MLYILWWWKYYLCIMYFTRIKNLEKEPNKMCCWIFCCCCNVCVYNRITTTPPPRTTLHIPTLILYIIKIKLKTPSSIILVDVIIGRQLHQWQIKQHVDVGFATFIQLTTWIYIQFIYKYTQQINSNNHDDITQVGRWSSFDARETCPSSCLRVDFIVKQSESRLFDRSCSRLLTLP